MPECDVQSSFKVWIKWQISFYKSYACLNNIILIYCDVTPLGASSQGLLPGRGEISGIVLSISGRERSSPLALERDLILYLSLGIGSGGQQFEEYVSRKETPSRDRRAMLMCPGVPPLVRSPARSSHIFDRGGPALGGYSRAHTTAREEGFASLPVPWNEWRIWSNKAKDGYEPRPGQPGRSDPTHQDLDSCITSSRSKQIPAGGGGLGPGPRSSIDRWRTPLTADRTRCAKGLRKRRGA